MKKFLLIGIVVAVALIIGLSGCAAQKVYSLQGQGYCYEVATNDLELQNALLDAGYGVGACSLTDQLGKCTFDITYETQTATVSAVYYEGTYFTDAATASTACSLVGGTWTAAQ